MKTGGMRCAGAMLAVALVVLGTAVRSAAPADEALRLFNEGRFPEAAELAAASETAPGLALAARAILAHAIYVTKDADRADEVRRGRDYAERALDIDPDNVEAHLQFVVALHQLAVTTSPFDAFMRGYAKEARSHIETALRLDPENPWGYSLLAGWNFEVVRLAGPLLAKMMFDASLDAARAAFAKAVAGMPGSVAIRYETARALVAIDPRGHREEAIGLLMEATRLQPHNAVDRLVAARARTLLEEIRSEPADDPPVLLHEYPE